MSEISPHNQYTWRSVSAVQRNTHTGFDRGSDTSHGFRGQHSPSLEESSFRSVKSKVSGRVALLTLW